VLTLALLVIAGSLICLDRTQAFQTMLSRPVVIGVALGFWAGHVAGGAAIGVAFEFLYAGRLPVGSNVPPSDTLAALGAGGLLVLVPRYGDLDHAGMAAAFALPLAEWGRFVDITVRRVNGRIASRIDALVAEGDYGYVEAAPWLAMAVAGLAFGLSLLVFYVTASVLIVFLGEPPAWLRHAFGLFVTGLPLVGFADSASTLDMRRFARWAAAGLAAGILVLWVI
jgi:mannose/fructose/N-acetylgalactosamine-specific phosphotransferase system component IIC